MSAELPFHRLLEPASIGRMTLRNRMVMAPMGTGFATADGFVNDRVLAYYSARARGGVGMVIVEGTCADFPEGLGVPNQPRIHEDGYIAGMARLVDVIHEGGAKAGVQLFHGGRAAKSRLAGAQPVAPSASGSGPDAARELGREEIRAVVQRFGDAAGRVKRAGFDGVEIHGAHAYLIANFLSGATNKRQDEYGGDLVGRARFLLETIAAVRDAVGPEFPVWVRLNGEELRLAGGTTIEETVAVAKMAEAAGVDAIHITGFGYGHPEMWASTPHRRGFLLPYAGAVKQAVGIPVIAVGRMNPDLAEEAIAQGKADCVAFGRELLADPELPRKVAEGRPEDIRPCLACVKCRDTLVASGGAIPCSVNPALGRELEMEPVPAAQPKKVVVVGGGPAGMEAARVAALRGHKVTLFEKEQELGGQLVPGSRPPEKGDLIDLRRYLAGQLDKIGVAVKLGREATAETVAALAPDTVVLASGTVPVIPELPGMAAGRVVTALDVLSGAVPVGDRVAVVGGELVGCETADLLAAAGKQVTVLRRGPSLATRVNPSPRLVLLRRLATRGVRTLTGVQYEGITDEGIAIVNANGEREVVPADTIVVATGGTPQRALEQGLEGKVPAVHLVGDCAEPRDIMAAMADGHRLGLQI